MLKPYDVRTLPEDGDLIESPLERAWLEEVFAELGPSSLGLSPTGDGHARIELRAVAGAFTDMPAVRIRGQVQAPFRVDCVRCLAPVAMPLSAELDLTLFPESPEPSTGQEPKGAGKKSRGRIEKIELSSRELDEGTYAGFELDLPHMVREALLLELEMNPSCADLDACQARVQALAPETGSPAGEPAEADGIDPRWAPLQKFRLKSS